MRQLTLTLAIGLFSGLLMAQEKENPVECKIQGFVGVNAFYDSRQSLTVRNGNIYLFPKAVSPDDMGEDVNAHGRFDVDAAYSRLGVSVTGPVAWGARTMLALEGDFLGKSGATDLNLRLRHAYIRLDWEKVQLLAGQYWHPMFLTDNIPGTVNLNAGAPFHPLSRAPQVKLAYKAGSQLEIAAFLVSQNDFVNTGLSGASENAILPELDAQLKYKNENGLFLAFTAGWKSMKPSLEENGTVTDERVESTHFSASFGKKFRLLSIKMEGLYGGNMTNLVMIGGVARDTENSSLLRTAYTPVKNASFWADIQTNATNVQPGLFFGYSLNLGAEKEAEYLEDYELGGDIGKIWALSPRLKFQASDKIWFGLEWLYTLAAYGTSFDDHARPAELEDVSNHRLIASLRYVF